MSYSTIQRIVKLISTERAFQGFMHESMQWHFPVPVERNPRSGRTAASGMEARGVQGFRYDAPDAGMWACARCINRKSPEVLSCNSREF